MENNQEEIDIVGFLKFAIRRKNIILFFTLVGIAVSIVSIYIIPIKYKAEGIINIGKVKTQTGDYFIQDVTVLEYQINDSFSQNHPNTKASAVSEGVLKINDISLNREEAIKNVLEAEVLVVEQSGEYKRNAEQSIESLKAMIGRLQLRGQQTEAMELRVFDMQNELNTITPTKTSGDVTVSATRFSPILSVIVGILLGIIVGLVVSGILEWFKKNKKNFL